MLVYHTSTCKWAAITYIIHLPSWMITEKSTVVLAPTFSCYCDCWAECIYSWLASSCFPGCDCRTCWWLKALGISGLNLLYKMLCWGGWLAHIPAMHPTWETPQRWENIHGTKILEIKRTHALGVGVNVHLSRKSSETLLHFFHQTPDLRLFWNWPNFMRI